MKDLPLSSIIIVALAIIGIIISTLDSLLLAKQLKEQGVDMRIVDSYAFDKTAGSISVLVAAFIIITHLYYKYPKFREWLI